METDEPAVLVERAKDQAWANLSRMERARLHLGGVDACQRFDLRVERDALAAALLTETERREKAEEQLENLRSAWHRVAQRGEM